MTNLLIANLKRVFHNKAFWISNVFLIFVVLFSIINYVSMADGSDKMPLESGMFMFVLLMAMIIAAFISLFTGTEYSDGTIRNKLIVGHKRSNVYMANLLSGIIAIIVMCLVYLGLYTLLAIVFLGPLSHDISSIMKMLFCAFMLMISMTALFTMVTMVSLNKPVAIVICILGSFLLLFMGIYLESSLKEPEYYEAYSMTMNGVTEEEEAQPNPHYLSGTKREVYQFLYDFTSGGQTVQVVSMSVAKIWLRLSAYSAVILVVSTAAGLYLFEKRDIK